MVEYLYTKHLTEGLRTLEKRGGGFRRAAQEVYSVLGKINSSQENPFDGIQATKNGESRIKHCVKYDLPSACRLVTVKHEKYCFLLFVGDHEDTDRWLDTNRGKTFVAEGKTIVEVALPSDVVSVQNKPKIPDRHHGADRLVDRIHEKLIEPLLDVVPNKVYQRLIELTAISSDSEICDIALEIKDSELQNVVYDCFEALARGRSKDAERVIGLYLGTIEKIDEQTDLNDSQNIQIIPTNDPEWLQLYQHFVRTASYKDWMLFLHPDQRQAVSEDYKGSAKLLGVSGSGKTCIVVKRAVRLAKKYPDKKILVLTLNRPLAALIRDLVDAASSDDIKNKIDVMAFFDMCQRLLNRFEPENEKLYTDVTWKGEEHVDTVWREYYRCDLNNETAKVMLPIHDSLISQSVNAENYIREEFDWVRSAVPGEDRSRYFDIERKGRSFPLQAQQRRLILEGLSGWQEKMVSVGVFDTLGLVSALQRHRDKILPEYQSVLVDECQDFGTSELDIVRRLVVEGENDIFLCGDAVQQVSSKYQKLSEAGITIQPYSSKKIYKNYRNSKEILGASYNLMVKHINEFHFDREDFEVLDPEFADFSGSTPLILTADNLEDEIASSIAFVNEEIKNNPNWKACIAIAGYSIYEIQAFGKRVGIPVLDGSRSITDESIYISDLQHTKGFEFDVVVVANIRDSVIPNPTIPDVEKAKDMAKLYVAMTRAKSQLVLSYSNQKSSFIEDMDDVFLEDDWCSYIPVITDKFGIPPLLAEIARLDQHSNIPVNLAEMTGEQFLYSDEAVGLSSLLTDAIRHKIGPLKFKSEQSTIAVDMGYAHQKISAQPEARRKFGPEASKQLINLGDKIHLSVLHKIRRQKSMA